MSKTPTDDAAAQGGPSDTERIAAWFRGRLPDEWTTTEPDVTVDREEITVVVALPGADQAGAGTGNEASHEAGDNASHEAGDEASHEERAGRVSRFREETRRTRMRIADEAEARFGRKVAWGVRADGSTEHFTRLAVPVMTRLRQPERLVLDTLVDAGVARSRSHALAWCVRLVGERSSDWLADLREAMTHVERVRNAGPTD